MAKFQYPFVLVTVVFSPADPVLLYRLFCLFFCNACLETVGKRAFTISIRDLVGHVVTKWKPVKNGLTSFRAPTRSTKRAQEISRPASSAVALFFSLRTF